MIDLDLYMTSACHLCEQAASVVKNCHMSIQLKMIDIANDELLIEKYGTRIPVLKLDQSKEELSWPFNEDQLIQYIERA